MITNTSLIRSLNPFIIFLKYFGCFPFQIIRINHSIIHFKISKLKLFYGIILVSASTYYTIKFRFKLENDSIIRSFLDADAIIISIGSVMCILVYWCNIRVIGRVNEQIFIYSKYLKDDEFTKKISRVAICFFVCFFGSCLAVFLMLYFIYFSGENRNIFLIIGHVLTTFYFLFIVNSVILHFSCLLIYYYKIFESINLELKKLAERVEICFVENFKYLFVYNFSIEDLVVVYIEICNLCEEINDAFGGSLAAAILIAFLQLLASSHQFINNAAILMFVVWFGYYIVLVWFILYPCEIIKNEVRRVWMLGKNIRGSKRQLRWLLNFKNFSPSTKYFT